MKEIFSQILLVRKSVWWIYVNLHPLMIFLITSLSGEYFCRKQPCTMHGGHRSYAQRRSELAESIKKKTCEVGFLLKPQKQASMGMDKCTF